LVYVLFYVPLYPNLLKLAKLFLIFLVKISFLPYNGAAGALLFAFVIIDFSLTTGDRF